MIFVLNKSENVKDGISKTFGKDEEEISYNGCLNNFLSVDYNLIHELGRRN